MPVIPLPFFGLGSNQPISGVAPSNGLYSRATNSPNFDANGNPIMSSNWRPSGQFSTPMTPLQPAIPNFARPTWRATGPAATPAPQRLAKKSASTARKSSSSPTPAKARKAALEHTATGGTGARVTLLQDPTGRSAPTIGSVGPMTASPLDPTVSARLSAGGQQGGQIPGMEDFPAFDAQAGAQANLGAMSLQNDPVEQARINALEEVLARWKANGGQIFQGPGSHAYSGSQVFGGGGADGSPGSVPLGPVTGPDQANGGRGQFTPEAIAAYILDRWGDTGPDGGGRTNMTPENILFLQNLRD